MKNIDVRMIISDSGVTYKAVARQMGISRGWLSRLMRFELSPANRKRILGAVQEIKEEGLDDGKLRVDKGPEKLDERSIDH